MSCYYPSLAVDLGVLPATGKHKIKFVGGRADTNIQALRSKYGSDLLVLPCGKCLACKVTKAKDWAVRSVLEMQYHSSSVFLTLTYDDSHLPKKSSIVKRHLQEFFKHLRNWRFKFRYLACCERGETTNRLHAHVILFGVDFSLLRDIEEWSKGSDGDKLYHSSWLDARWKYGRVIIGSATYESVAYVARYTTKKVGDDDSFILASNRPGLGLPYLIDNLDIVLSTDKVYGNFGAQHFAALPRYFNSYLRANYPVEFEKLVQERIRRAKIMNLSEMSELFVENLEEVFCYQSSLLDSRYKRLKRGVL